MMVTLVNEDGNAVAPPVTGSVAGLGQRARWVSSGVGDGVIAGVLPQASSWLLPVFPANQTEDEAWLVDLLSATSLGAFVVRAPRGVPASALQGVLWRPDESTIRGSDGLVVPSVLLSLPGGLFTVYVSPTFDRIGVIEPTGERGAVLSAQPGVVKIMSAGSSGDQPWRYTCAGIFPAGTTEPRVTLSSAATEGAVAYRSLPQVPGTVFVATGMVTKPLTLISSITYRDANGTLVHAPTRTR